METITNAASSVVSSASNLIYGQPAKDNESVATTTTTGNETGGKEPLSGEQGKGTVSEPFDQGNKENAAGAAGNTSYKQDDFLKLDPAAGKPTESFGDNKTGATSESSLPIIPLNPDAASMSTTGATDSAAVGVSDKVWKPTALDEVKPEGLSTSTPSKADEPAPKDTTTSADETPAPKKESSGPPAASEPPKEHSVGGDIDKILESTPKSKHTVNDSEASDPHSKMTGTTVRQTEASKHGESENSKSLATEKTGDTSASHASGDTADDKDGKKMSTKDKLKQKLHIGHKDK